MTLNFPGFTGTPKELSDWVRRGKFAAKELPVLELTNQALAQVEALKLSERSELLPLLAGLLLLKLRAFSKQLVVEEEVPEEEAPNFLETLVALEEAIAFLTQRSAERSRVIPVPPPMLPKDRRLRSMPLQALVRAAQPFARRAELMLEPERFGLKEAWERIKNFLRLGSGLFSRLPFKSWLEQNLAFTALLEAKRMGDVELLQEENFGPIRVSLESSDADSKPIEELSLSDEDELTPTQLVNGSLPNYLGAKT
jgi:segregation and condensation protein A